MAKDYSDVGSVFPLKTYAIADVDTTSEWFKVAGDQTHRFNDGDTFTVVDSTGNDGEYTVASTSYSEIADETQITVDQDITNATADGTVLHDEIADPLDVTLSHDDTTDRDLDTPDQIAGAHIQRIVNEMRKVNDTIGLALGLAVIDAGGLNIYYSGGRLIFGSGAPIEIAPDKLTLADDDTNYIQVNSTGVVSANTTGFPGSQYPLAVVVTASGDITSIADKRGALYLAEFAEMNFEDLGDVAISGIVDGEIAVWVAGSAEWQNKTLDEAGIFAKDGSVDMTGDLPFNNNDATDLATIFFKASTELTIAAGVVTGTQGVHRVDTEADAASDDLDTINGGTEGMLLLVRAENAARTVVLKDGTGNLELAGADLTLDDTDRFALLYYDGTLTKWVLIGGGAVDLSAYFKHDGSVNMSGDLPFNDNKATGLKQILFTAATELTIAVGVITGTQGVHRIDTEADAASDDLDTISGGTAGMFLLIRAENAARTVVLKDGTGNIELAGGDITLDDTDQFVILYYDGTLSKWTLAGGGGGVDLSEYFKHDGSVNMSGDLPFNNNDATDLATIFFKASTELTIAAGVVTGTQGVHRIDTEGDAASDDLDTISGGSEGMLLLIRADNAARTIVLKDGTGNLELAGADISLDDTNQFVILYYDGTLSKWIIVGGSATFDLSPYLKKDGSVDYLKQVFEATTELTIAAGVVTATQTTHRIDTEADAATDDLDTINGGGDGQVIFIRAENTGRTVVLKDGTGNLELAGADISLDDTNQFVILYYDGTLSKWVIVGGSATFDLSPYLKKDGTVDVENMTLEAAIELTIAAGVVTRTGILHSIDTESDDPSDDLVTINGGADGVLLIVRAENAARTVVLKDGTGNLELGGQDITLDDTDKAISLYYDGTLSKWLLIGVNPTAGAGGAAWRFVDLPAGAWDYSASNPAPLDTDTGANGIIKRHLFDDTTEEFIIAQFRIPSDLDTGGTVYFELYGYAVTAAASKNVEFTFYHSAKNDGESWDAAHSSKVSGDLACDAIQDQLDSFSWNETIATLGWAVDDLVRIKLSRTAPSVNNLVGDYGMTHFRLKIPRA